MTSKNRNATAIRVRTGYTPLTAPALQAMMLTEILRISGGLGDVEFSSQRQSVRPLMAHWILLLRRHFCHEIYTVKGGKMQELVDGLSTVGA
jgi:hypothetical protein